MREILKSLCSERQLVLLDQNFFKCSYWQTWYWSICKNLWSFIETIRRIIPEQPFLDFQRCWTPLIKSFLPVIKVSWLQIKIGLKMLNQLWGLFKSFFNSHQFNTLLFSQSHLWFFYRCFDHKLSPQNSVSNSRSSQGRLHTCFWFSALQFGGKHLHGKDPN